MDDTAHASDDWQQRKHDKREMGKDSGRSFSAKGGGDSHRYSEKSYSSTHDHHRHDEYRRHHGHNVRERNYKRSAQSYRESRTGDDRRDSDHGRSRDYRRSTDKYSQERPDYEGNRGKNKGRESEAAECQKHKNLDSFSDRRREREYMKDSVRCSGEKKDRDRFSYEEVRGHGKDSSGKERSGSYHKETQIYSKDSAEQKYSVAEKKKYDDIEYGRHKEGEKSRNISGNRGRLSRGEYSEDESSHINDDNDSSAKKLKLVVSDDETGRVKDDEGLMSSSSMTSHGIVRKEDSKPAYSSTNQEEATHDLNAAKVAAMKAAELVNRNLVAGGFVSADQKKKLLWGNKKNTVAEESGNHWDVSTFSDQERQEKFYKLMSLSLPWYIWPIVGGEGQFQDGAEIRKQRWRQPPSGREAAGAPTGFREAIHCRPQAKRWTYSWLGSLIFPLELFLTHSTMLRDTTLYCLICCKQYASYVLS